MIKQCIPITYFEKWQPILQELCFNFFSKDNPGVEKVSAFIRNIKTAQPKTETERRIYIQILEIINHDITTYMERLDDVNIDLKKINSGKLTKKEAADYMDAFYMARMGMKIDNNTLHINLKDQETDKDEGNVYNVLERMLWAMYYYDQAGRNNIRVEEQLTQELILTDVRGVTAGFLKLPHNSFSVFLPYNNSLTIRRELIRQIYVHETTKVVEDKVLRMLEFCFIDVNERIETITILFDDDKSLVEQAADHINLRYQSPLAKREITDVVNFVMATVLYINSIDKVEKTIFPSVLMKKKHSRFPCCALGYGITIDKTVYESPNPGTGQSHQIHVLKFTVRGHFRAYRPGEDKRWKKETIIWIRPHLKGRERDNDLLEVKPKQYELKK
jgi:hypothetical protein